MSVIEPEYIDECKLKINFAVNSDGNIMFGSVEFDGNYFDVIQLIARANAHIIHAQHERYGDTLTDILNRITKETQRLVSSDIVRRHYPIFLLDALHGKGELYEKET